MYCVYCNQQLPDEAAFCFKCGRPVPDEVRAAVAGGQAAVQPQPMPQAVAAPAQQVQQPAAQPPVAPEPTYQAVTTNAVAGDNVMSFVTISNALAVVEPLATDPNRARALKVDPEVAESLRVKLQNAFEFLADLHKVNDKMGQAMGVMKRVGRALTSGEVSAGQLREDPNSWLCTQDLTAPEAELYNLAGRQSELREGLETRVLRLCESCKYQRINNPDYEHMVATQNRLDSLLMLPGNTLMALARFRRAAPKFVCPRCQGLKATERTIVLCPSCGTPNLDLLLSKCGKCGYDFVTRSGGKPQPPTETAEEATREAPQPEPARAAKPTKSGKSAKPGKKAAPQPGPSGKILVGKCADCGNEFRVPVEKIPAEGLKAKCAKCGRPLRIRVPKSEG